MKKQVGLLEFEYLPKENKCVIRASYNNFEYGSIVNLDRSPCITTQPDASVNLVVIQMAMDFVQEAQEHDRSVSPTT